MRIISGYNARFRAESKAKGPDLLPSSSVCSKIPPILPTASSASRKPEGRNPKPEGRPKSDIRNKQELMDGGPANAGAASGFGLRISFGLRASGLRICASPPFILHPSSFVIRLQVALLALCWRFVGALGSHEGGFVGALRWLWGRIEVA
jgi:hypothetical protein